MISRIGMGLFKVLQADFQRHGASWKEPGIWVLAAYRVRASAAALPRTPLRPILVSISEKFAFALGLVTRTSIPARVKIGEEFHLIHAMNISIAPDVEIGDRVGIMHQVTIGPSHDRPGVPKIGNDVFIGAGATILGPVSIGDGAMISANSLVISDVPAGGFAVGVPAKAIVWGKNANSAKEKAPSTSPAPERRGATGSDKD